MTCMEINDWLGEEGRGDAIEQFLGEPRTRDELLGFFADNGYPDMVQITDLANRLPEHAIQLLASAWMTSRDGGRGFHIQSVGPDETRDQIADMPSTPENGLAINIHFDGSASGGVTVTFEGTGDAAEFFSHDSEERGSADAGALPWFSAGSS